MLAHDLFEVFTRKLCGKLYYSHSEKTFPFYCKLYSIKLKILNHVYTVVFHCRANPGLSNILQ